jgi:hypothetical protein
LGHFLRQSNFLLARRNADYPKGTAAVNHAVILGRFSSHTPAAAPSKSFSPKQPPTGNNRQIGERQTEGHAYHEAAGLTHRATMMTAKTLAAKM